MLFVLYFFLLLASCVNVHFTLYSVIKVHGFRAVQLGVVPDESPQQALAAEE
jgi:hypothetical protein